MLAQVGMHCCVVLATSLACRAVAYETTYIRRSQKSKALQLRTSHYSQYALHISSTSLLTNTKHVMFTSVDSFLFPVPLI